MIPFPFNYIGGAGSKPSLVSAPIITQTPLSNIFNYATPGVWDGDEVIVVTHEWLVNGLPTGQIGSTYAALPGETVSLLETATNDLGFATSESNEITQAGIASGAFIDSAGLTYTVDSSISPAGTYNLNAFDSAGLTWFAGTVVNDPFQFVESSSIITSIEGSPYIDSQIHLESSSIVTDISGSTYVDAHLIEHSVGLVPTITGSYV